jgi:hypothetical protein
MSGDPRWLDMLLVERECRRLKPARINNKRSIGTAEQAAEKVEKQIPRRPEGLLVMTRTKDLQRRS